MILMSGAAMALAGERAMGGTFTWRKATPESRGMDGRRLDALREVLAARRTKTFLVVRHDRIVHEWYAPGYGPRKRHYTASLAKALVGGTSLMLALNDDWVIRQASAARLKWQCSASLRKWRS